MLPQPQLDQPPDEILCRHRLGLILLGVLAAVLLPAWGLNPSFFSTSPQGQYLQARDVFNRVIGGFLTRERNYAICRQIAGTSKVVCIEAPHHNGGRGNVLIVDLKYGRDSKEGHEVLVSGPGGREAEVFVPNVYCIYADGYKKCYTYRSYWNLQKYVKMADINRYFTPPGTWGSRVSPLMKHLAKGDKKVKLSQTEWRTLCAWIDCNLPYLDDWRKYSADPETRKTARKD